MDVLLVGSDTPVGLELQRLFAYWGRHQATAMTLAASRFRSERQAKKAARRGRPQALVDLHVAARLATDHELQDIDIERCHWLAKACERSGIRYLLLGSDRVFSGEMQRPLREADPGDATDPQGMAWIDLEGRVLDASPSAMVLRTGPLFGGDDDRLLGAVLAALLEQRSVRLDNSDLFCPSAAMDVARVIAAILDQMGVGAEPQGRYHYCSLDRTSHYGFAETALASASQFADLGDAQLLARDDSGTARVHVLDCSKLRDTFAIKQQPWRSQINLTVKSFLRNRELAENPDG